MNRSFFFLCGERDVSVIPIVQYKENTTELVLTILTKNTKKIVQNPMGKKKLSHDPNSKICVLQP